MAPGQPGIFQDLYVLTDKFIPPQLQHRSEQLQQLRYYLSTFVKYGIITNNLVLFGPPGTGKTHTTKHVLCELEKDLSVFYAKAYKNITHHSFLKTFLESHFRIRLHPKDSISVYYSEFEKALDGVKNAIVVMDDIQFLVENDPKGFDRLLFYLSRVEGNFGLILIGNISMNDLTEILSPPTLSTLKLRSIFFPKYNATELKDILEERSKKALHREPHERSLPALAKIAALTAQEWGSARYALDLMIEAGRISEELFKQQYITIEAVDKADELLEVSKMADQLRNLPKQPFSVLEAIYRLKAKGLKTITSGEVYEQYEQVCRQLGLRPKSQRRMGDLLAELDMVGMINCRIYSKGRYGRTREIQWTLDPALERVYRQQREMLSL